MNPELIYEYYESSYIPFGLECDAEEDRHCNFPCPGKIFLFHQIIPKAKKYNI